MIAAANIAISAKTALESRGASAAAVSFDRCSHIIPKEEHQP
jgi:hypothetical protein